MQRYEGCCPIVQTRGQTAQKGTKKDKKGQKILDFVPKTYKKGCPNGQPCTLKVFGFICSHFVYKLFEITSQILSVAGFACTLVPVIEINTVAS